MQWLVTHGQLLRADLKSKTTSGTQPRLHDESSSVTDVGTFIFSWIQRAFPSDDQTSSCLSLKVCRFRSFLSLRQRQKGAQWGLDVMNACYIIKDNNAIWQQRRKQILLDHKWIDTLTLAVAAPLWWFSSYIFSFVACSSPNRRVSANTWTSVP